MALEKGQQTALMHTPPPARSLVWLNALFAAAVPSCLLAALVAWLQIEDEISFFTIAGIPVLAWFRPFENFFGTQYENYFLAMALPVLAILLYLATYAVSFSRHARSRPRKRIFVLHAAFAALLCGWTLPGIGFASGVLAYILLGVIILVYSALAWGIERGLAKLVYRLSEILQNKDLYDASNTALAISIRLSPGNWTLQRDLGLSRFETGDLPGALNALEPIREYFPQDKRMLQVIEECYRTERKWEEALKIGRQLLNLEQDNETMRLRLARTLHELGRLPEAIALLWEGLPSESLEYCNQLLNYYLEAEEADSALETAQTIEKIEGKVAPKAEAAYRTILQLAPQNRKALLKLAELLIRNRKEEEGYALFEKIVELDPQRDEIRKRLVHYYNGREDILSAEPHLAALLDAGRDNAEVALLYGDILMQREEYDRALLHFQYAEENYPDDFRFPYFLAQISFKTQSLEDARRWCQEAERRVTKKEEKRRLKSLRTRIEQGLISREIQMLEERSKREPENTELRLNLLSAMCRHGMVDKAVGEYDVLLSSKPKLRTKIIQHLETFLRNEGRNFRIMDYLFDLKLQTAQWDDAYELILQMAEKSLDGEQVLLERSEKLLERNPEHIPSLEILRDAGQKQEHWTDVALAARQLMDLGADTRENREAFLEAAIHQQDTDAAIEVAKKLIEDDTHNVDLRVQLVRLYAEQNRFDEALTELQKAQSMDYYHADVVKLMQNIKHQKEKHRLLIFKERMQKDPTDHEAFIGAGDIYMHAGQNKQAVACYQKVANRPECKNYAGAKLARAMMHLRMYDLAEEALDEIQLHSENPEEEKALKALVYEVADQFFQESMPERALKFFKKIFRVDAAFRDIVDRIDQLTD